MWPPLPAMLAFSRWMLLYVTTQSPLQERWYFADLAWRSTLFINRKCFIFPISKRCYIHQTWVFVGPVGKFLSAFCSSCNTTHLSTSHTIYTNWWKNIHSNSGPSLGNISHIHEWERHHGEGWRRRSKFRVNCEWHSVISDISGRGNITEWPREEIAWILLFVQRVKWYCKAPFTNC